MPGLEHYVGQVLDDKYRLEQLLGQGGMGAVYLATHLGTERYVALKLISPQFMRNSEFVERFKREARAAGRLRHPNVVDVTDFGFARVKEGQVAYLVMEYLDGCTLGDVLAEEKKLPLEWVADIMEQVCSAVNEAHQQGIIHRDLKPDNIWLEPNRLGGYRVKVLDFGIAKLGPTTEAPPPEEEAAVTIIDDVSELRAHSDLEVKTLMQAPNLTRQLTHNESLTDEDGTLLFSETTGGGNQHTATTVPSAALTRVGAIMGTPLYMSPEQCGGGTVDMRSDIYSLGVIAYQMLAGEPPFSGNTSAVMRAHREDSPRHLRERGAKIPKRVAGVVMSALAKNPAERPATAFAFASSLRGQTEGIGALYRRAFSLYSEYFPKFVKLSVIAHIPVFVTTILMSAAMVAEHYMRGGPRGPRIAITVVMAIVALAHVLAYMVSSAVISGVTAIIVTQLTAAPLRPVELRVAFGVLKKRWRPFVRTVIRVTLKILLGTLLFVIPGIVIWIRNSLYAPVVLMEGLAGKAAMKRARELASRSWRTIIAVSILQIVIPMTVSFLVGRIRIGINVPRASLSNQLYQQVLGLANIFVVPLIAIVPALLYLKMRQLGGESLSTALAQFEEVDGERSKWQQRMRTRLSLHTPTSHSRVRITPASGSSLKTAE
ncbi:MAG TPA: serine/threonine-protein kinase [Pyrinomonadaceae bacterium]|nr:serine/threonine-protein kinase [Pyrinomonadaceae bacterium]